MKGMTLYVERHDGTATCDDFTLRPWLMLMMLIFLNSSVGIIRLEHKTGYHTALFKRNADTNPAFHPKAAKDSSEYRTEAFGDPY